MFIQKFNCVVMLIVHHRIGFLQEHNYTVSSSITPRGLSNFVVVNSSLLFHNVALLSSPERKAQMAHLTTGKGLKPDHISLCSEKNVRKEITNQIRTESTWGKRTSSENYF